MADRRVSVKLSADISDYVSKMAQAAASTRTLGQMVEKEITPGMRRAGENAGREFGESTTRGIDANGPLMRTSGERSGGLLSQGIRGGLMRNSPLIVAGVAGALAAGAPVMTAAAVTLFAGIGAVAAAQSDEVRSAWLGMWEDIQSAATQDAAALVPVFTRVAAEIGSAFERLRPQLRDAFEAVGPQIEVVAQAMTRMAQNAMPGLLQAVTNGMPVMQGLGALMEDLGTGVSDFFSIMADHAPAAGVAFAAIGDIVGDLLPVLGQLMGQGVELAAVILPPVAQALGVVAGALEAIGPLLPVVATGFAALKIAQSVQGWIGGISDKVDDLGKKGGVASGAMSALAGAFSPLNIALGGSAILVGIFMSKVQEANATTDKWAEGLRAGGASAKQVMEEAQAASDAYVDNWGGDLARFLDQWAGITPTIAEAEEANRKYFDSLTPLQQAQEKVSYWTAETALRMSEQGPAATNTAIAQERVAFWSGQAATEQARLDMATRGVTEAMLLQQEQAYSLANADFAHRQAVDATEEAYRNLQTVMQETPGDAEKVADAVLAVEGALLREIEAKRRLVQESLPATLDANQKESLANYLMLEQLRQLAIQHGDKLPESIRKQISMLEQATGQTDINRLASEALRAKMNELGGAQTIAGDRSGALRQQMIVLAGQLGLNQVESQRLTDKILGIPGSKNVVITADTGPAQARINAFVAEVMRIRLTLEPGSVSRAATNQTAFRATGGAIGGIVHAYEEGGFEPMKGGVAQVVAPNTWRVIGDRVKDDEAYIPINNAPRSREILKQTAQRMGFALFAEGGLADSYSIPVDMRPPDINPWRALYQSVFAPSGGSSTGLLPIMAAARQYVMDTYGVRNIGGFAKRNIAGTSIPSDHSMGKAIDIMTSNLGLGWAIANDFAYGAARGRFRAENVIWQQSISSNGGPFRRMGDRGSPTQNHYDHVHVDTYDGGGLASGMGFLPKSTIAPERVLSPQQTAAFEDALGREFNSHSGPGVGGGAVNVEVHARVFVGNQEITDIARVESTAVMVQALNTITSRGRNNP